jgi:signal transduction histidine kinase
MVLRREHDLMVALEVSGESHLRPEQAQRLFRIAQEALNNVVKHAETDRAYVTLWLEDEHTILEVRDHGKGFAPGAVDTGRGHIGLSTMLERAEQMGGTLAIDSRPGYGTRVVVEVPALGPGFSLKTAQEQA